MRRPSGPKITENQFIKKTTKKKSESESWGGRLSGAKHYLTKIKKKININADKGFAPFTTGHEPIMFLLH
jgi:hypothetical protein